MDENQRILAKGASAQRLRKPILFILSCEKRPKSGQLRGRNSGVKCCAASGPGGPPSAPMCVVHVNGVNLCYQEFRVQGAQAYLGYLCQRSYSKTWEGGLSNQLYLHVQSVIARVLQGSARFVQGLKS